MDKRPAPIRVALVRRRFLARAFRHAYDRGIRGVVSFADPLPRRRQITETLDNGTTIERIEQTSPGHIGGIYQSVNAIALGRSTARTLNYLPRRGLVLSERSLSKVRGQERGADAAERHLVSLGAPIRRAGQDPRAWLREALAALDVTKIRHPGNFRYKCALLHQMTLRRLRAVRDHHALLTTVILSRVPLLGQASGFRLACVTLTFDFWAGGSWLISS